MDNNQRDEKITETHTAVTLLVKEIKEVRSTLYGNGQPGIKIDVDRLKNFKKVSCWFFGAMTLAGMTVVGKLIYNFIAS